MNQSTYNSLKSFVWGIANDCLVDVYDVGDYRKVILPMLVIRRFDAILEPFHDKIIQRKKSFDAKSITVDIAPAMKNITGEQFVNTSPFTLNDLKSRTDRQNLERDFRNYLDGFSANVQEIIEKFHFHEQIPRLINQDRLGLLIAKFLDPKINLSNKPVLNEDGTERLEALDNHAMGTLFEEVIRMFNEQTNVTDAGRHFTPRDIIELMADLAFIPVQDKIESNTYRIYDGACGTGGMLTVGESRIMELAKENGKDVSIFLFGQENFDETYAIACADMLLKGENSQLNQIKFGSTISDDKFTGETFDFMLSNPPFGTSWKVELGAGSEKGDWKNYSKKDDISDARFLIDFDGNPEFSLVPDIGDPQMLFLANNVSKVKTKTKLGSRIVEVHNGSSLFTGSAGQGASNLRRYIIENDMLEAIVALPEKMFYNTGIGTYLWIVTNKKDDARKGTVQLIDATSLKSTLRKNLGEKNCEITSDIRKKILEIYLAYKNADENFSKVFQNEEFGYYSVDIQRPLRLRVTLDDEKISALADEQFAAVLKIIKDNAGEKFLDFNKFLASLEKFCSQNKIPLNAKRKKILRENFTEVDEDAEPVQKSDGTFEPDKNLKDTEQIPLTYAGGIDKFFADEIKPFVPDAWIDKNSVVIGYEITFTKYFYKPEVLRSPAEIVSDIRELEKVFSCKFIISKMEVNL